MVPGSAVNPKPRVGGATPKPAPKPKRGAVPQLPQRDFSRAKDSKGAATTNYKDLISLTPAPKPKRGAVPQLPQVNTKMGKGARVSTKDLISLTPAPRGMAKGGMTKKKGK
jgi:hypothetical protein